MTCLQLKNSSLAPDPHPTTTLLLISSDQASCDLFNLPTASSEEKLRSSEDHGQGLAKHWGMWTGAWSADSVAPLLCMPLHEASPIPQPTESPHLCHASSHPTTPLPPLCWNFALELLIWNPQKNLWLSLGSTYFNEPVLLFFDPTRSNLIPPFCLLPMVQVAQVVRSHNKETRIRF